eukprot:IDg12900t1
MARTFFSNEYSAILAAPSNIEPSWAMALTENVLVPLLAYATESGSHVLRRDLSGVCISAITEAASVFYNSYKLKPQTRVEGCARALEVSMALTMAVDSEIAANIPVRDACALSSRNVLFSFALGELQSEIKWLANIVGYLSSLRRRKRQREAAAITVVRNVEDSVMSWTTKVKEHPPVQLFSQVDIRFVLQKAVVRVTSL